MKATACLFLLLVASWSAGVASAQADDGRLWIELPRASRAEVMAPGLPAAPAPNSRALDRRRRRGRPERVAVLERGPSRGALERLRSTGARIHFVSRWLSRASVEVDPGTLAALRDAFPEARVGPVRVTSRPLPRTQPLSRSSLHLKQAGLDYGSSFDQIHQIEVDRMHESGFSGTGVRVLVLDTGFLLSHVAFSRLNVIAEHDFVFGDSVTANEPEDPPHQHNHGTGVLGVIGGYAPGDLIGPAYDAEFLLAKTEYIATETRVEEDDFVAGLEWGEALGADLATASLGYLAFPDEPDSFSYAPEDLDGDTAVTTRAMDDAVALGMVTLSAVGNSGSQGPSSLITPSDGDSVLAIGSVRADSTVSAFSSRGPTFDGRIKPDLMARGTLTTWAAADSTFSQAYGTSLATPLAAGAATLILEAHPEWGPGQVAAALRSTATRAAMPDNDYGWGLVRAHAASFDVEAPIYPLPFELLSPPDSSMVAEVPVLFRWARARDLQEAVTDYRVQISSDADFTQLAAEYMAGGDTTRSVEFLPSGSFHWRVAATDPDGHVRFSRGRVLSLGASGVTASGPLPSVAWIHLSEPRPNPFNPRVTFAVDLEEPARVEAEIYDVAGRRVRRLFATSLAPGSHEWVWEGLDDRSRSVASGVYLLRLQARGRGGTRWEAHRRLVLVR